MENRLQTYLDNLGEGLSYSLNNNILYLLHHDFICEISIKTDKITVYTLGHQKINETDILLLYEIRQNLGMITSLGMEFASIK